MHSIDKILRDKTDKKKSKELLMGTEMSVTEVAYAAGFSDSSYFIQCFRKYEGITPGEYGKC